MRPHNHIVPRAFDLPVHGLPRRNFLKLMAGAAAVVVEAHGARSAPAVDMIEKQMTNLAFGRPVKVSSTAFAPTPGFCAVDGTRYSWWTSAPRDPSWIEVDLQAICKVDRIRIIFPHAAGDITPHPTRWTPTHDVLGSYAVAYQVEVSTDGKHWNTVFHTSNGVGGELYLRMDPQNARYIRMNCKRRSYDQYGVAMSSLEVFGVCSVNRPTPGGWTAPRPVRKSVASVLPPREDGHLIGGWEMEMIGSGGTSADGAVISKHGFNSRSWYDATVPGTVLTTLVDQGVFPDPLFGLNNLQIPEALNQYAWWYRKTFILPDSYRNKRVWLNFDGINYAAEVWLNGRKIGKIEGAFIRGVFDITDMLNLKGPDILAVKMNPPPHPGLPDEQSWKTGAGFNGGQPTRDGPNFFCTVGWDWIPGIRDRCTGIWSHVFLRTTGPVRIENPHVRTDMSLPDTTTARLSVSAEVHNADQAPQRVVLAGEVDGIHFEQPVSLAAGERKIICFDTPAFPQLLMRNPVLWWPNGYGPQHLYDLKLTVRLNGQISDEKTVSFGVRKYEYEKLPELVIKCNGHKIMCRGGNWGLDEAMKRIPYKHMDAWIRMHKIANLTIIRNWTGESNSEEFFALCDKYGIIVWTEFWMANPGDGPDPDDPAMLLANAEDTFKRYRNHPCIAIWCGRNEGPPPAMINAALNKMAADLDGTRYYQPGSSFAGVQSGGPYSFQEPQAYYQDRYNGFKTEIGCPSVPTLDSLKTTMPENQLWPPHNDTWAYHDYCKQGAMGITSYETAIGARFGSSANIEEFVSKCQMVNYEAYRGIFEGYLHKLWKNVSGTILWMSHPAQNSTVWQLYAHDLEAHASLYGARKACGMIHVQLSPVDGTIDLINHHVQPLHELMLTGAVHNLDGSQATVVSRVVEAPGNTVAHLFKLEIPAGASPAHFVKLTLHDHAGNLLADNFYWKGRTLGDLRAMNTMEQVRPTGRVTWARNGAMSRVEVHLHNATSRPAIAIKITPRKKGLSGPDSRILPAFISDNYFSLLPGEKKFITIEFYTEDGGNGAPVVEISGWNIILQMASCDNGAFDSATADAPAAAALEAAPAASWEIGPFVRPQPDEPVIRPDPSATFEDPIGHKRIPWEFSHTFNPAAIAWNNRIYVLYRAEDNTGHNIGGYTSRIGLAESTDGIHFTRHAHPVMYPEPGRWQTDEWPGGCEDPRIVQSEDGTFVLTYTMWNHKLARMGIATSRDLVHWIHHGPAFGQAAGGKYRNLYSKSGAIVTRKLNDRVVAAKINGIYYMYWINGHMAESSNLLDWTPLVNQRGGLRTVISTRSGHFDADLVEPGPPALLTGAGIVLIYNGMSAGNDFIGPNLPRRRYAAGQILLSAHDPTKILDRCEQPFLWPRRPWEKTGQYKAGTTFAQGLAWFKNNWYLYYGAADTCVGVVTTDTSVNL